MEALATPAEYADAHVLQPIANKYFNLKVHVHALSPTLPKIEEVSDTSAVQGMVKFYLN